jgi:hypothetical protein
MSLVAAYMLLALLGLVLTVVALVAVHRSAGVFEYFCCGRGSLGRESGHVAREGGRISAYTPMSRRTTSKWTINRKPVLHRF